MSNFRADAGPVFAEMGVSENRGPFKGFLKGIYIKGLGFRAKFRVWELPKSGDPNIVPK